MQSIDPVGCAGLIRQSESIVALTGAGISTAAGLADFRGPEGLYVTRRYDPDKVFDIDAFGHDPLPFYEFTRDFLGVIDTIQPTFTHCFLAALEAEGDLKAVVTQNIDPLHSQAGSREVIAVHGGYWTSHCLRCRKEFAFAEMRSKVSAEPVPHCSCGGVIKPDVVFFGENVLDLDLAAEAVMSCDLLLVLGSSLTVYPAAGLPRHAPGGVVVVNRGEVALNVHPNRWFADADLDTFFRAVAVELGIEAGRLTRDV